MPKNQNTVSPVSLAAQETVPNSGGALCSPFVSTNLHDQRNGDNGRYSQNRSTVFVQTRQETIDWLVANNFPALPVAPQQEPQKYPKRNKKGEIEYEGDGTPKPLFTGKNPSYLDKGGIPHLINHHKYQNKLPTKEELDKWFDNPQNGVGTLGGWNNAIWIDLDVKNFESASDCEEAALEIIEKLPHFPYFEKTHSGGYRILISHPDANKTTKECPEKITNFALVPGGKHVGECLSRGRFTVLAPTVGNSGNPYENINRAKPVPVENLADIGIYTTRKDKSKSTKSAEKADKPAKKHRNEQGISLELLINPNARAILGGGSISGDRSLDLSNLIKELFGWANWCEENHIQFSGEAYDFAVQAGEAHGADADKIDRIIAGINTNDCIPAAQEYGDTPCWKKIRKIDKKLYTQVCPKDIKEAISQEQRQSYTERIIKEYEVFKQKYSIKLDIEIQEDGRLKIPVADFFHTDQVFGSRIKYNEMLNDYELDGQQIDWNKIRLTLEKEGVNFTNVRRCEEVVREIGDRNTYSPVRDYLNTLPANNSDLLNNIATRYLGVPESDTLSNTFLRKWLIGAVKRVMEPGCCMDYMLILSGKPHCGKTQFFQNLASEDWFTSSFRDIGNKDNLRLLREFWILELGEVDQYLNVRTSEEYKSFISTQVDTYRIAYGRGNKRYPRTCAIAGTTNRGELLKDETGNRRYFMITIPDGWKIERDRIIAERDQIWSAALAAYKAKETIFLTPQEMEALNERNMEYMEHDVWQEAISVWLEQSWYKDWVTGMEVIELALRMPLIQADRKAQNRVGRIMRILGWEKKPKKIEGKLKKVYCRPVTVTSVNSSENPETTVSKTSQLFGATEINQTVTSTVTSTVTAETLTGSNSYNLVTVVTDNNKERERVYKKEGEYASTVDTKYTDVSHSTTDIPDPELTTPPQGNGNHGNQSPHSSQRGGSSGYPQVTYSEKNGNLNERIGVSAVTDLGNLLEKLKVGTKIRCYPTAAHQHRGELVQAEILNAFGSTLEIKWEGCQSLIPPTYVVEVLPESKWWEAE